MTDTPDTATHDVEGLIQWFEDQAETAGVYCSHELRRFREAASLIRQLQSNLDTAFANWELTLEYAESVEDELSRLRKRLEEAERVIEPLARLEVPAKPQGNAGAYSIFHEDIRAAKAFQEAE